MAADIREREGKKPKKELWYKKLKSSKVEKAQRSEESEKDNELGIGVIRG